MAPENQSRGLFGRSLLCLQLGLFLTILAAYLLGDSRTPPYNDSKQIYTAAESIVYRHSLGTPFPGGQFYDPHPLLTALAHVPGVMLRQAIAKADPAADRIVKPMTSHLGSQIAVAVGCLVFFRLLVHLGLSLASASLGTLVLAFATMMPIYARTAWSEALQAACYIGFFSSLIRLKDQPTRKTGIWFGIWTGLLVNSKYVFALSLPGAFLFLAYHAWKTKRIRALVGACLWPAVPGIAFLAIILWYNWVRTGSSFNSGYPTLAGLTETVFREDLLVGLWSYLFSFGKSIFLYCPPLLLSLVAIPLVAKRCPSVLWALLLTAGPLICLYSKFVHWSGDWCWGPRYILFVVPGALIPAVFLIDHCLVDRRRIVGSLCAVVFVMGVWVQIVGASQYWDAFIRVSKGAQVQWLGSPNRTGASTADRGGGCDPCFEDFYARNYTPPFQPIEMQSWYLKHHLWSHSWAIAAKDVPFKRYTTIEFPAIRQWYEEPHWDWWKLDFVGRYRRAGNWMLTALLAALLVGAALWIRGLRTVTAPSSETGRSGSLPLWPRLRGFLAPRFGRLRDRLRGRGR